MTAPKLDYYYFESCPFCQMVMEVINRNSIKVEYCDIFANKAHLDKLVSDTGRQTVPCLYIDGKPMHESRDIIAWLQSNLDNLEKTG